MLRRFFFEILRVLFLLRYRIQVNGLKEIRAKGKTGILFIANHPSLLDLPMLGALLICRGMPFRSHAPSIIMRHGLLGLPFRVIDCIGLNLMLRATLVEELRRCFTEILSVLDRRENYLHFAKIYQQRSKIYNLKGKSLPCQILRSTPPNTRIVLVRIRGMWGSSFSLAHGEIPHIPSLQRRLGLALLRNLLLFLPKREVTIDFLEAEDIRTHLRSWRETNAYLEGFFNEHPQPNLHVSYNRFSSEPLSEVLPEPEPLINAHWESLPIVAALRRIPWPVQLAVLEHLRAVSGKKEISLRQSLADDLGLDFFKIFELILWIQEEFGHTVSFADSLQTVEDVMMAATGRNLIDPTIPIQRPHSGWSQRPAMTTALSPNQQRLNIPHLFLLQLKRQPKAILLHDPFEGELSVGEVFNRVASLRGQLRRLPGTHVGLLLPGDTSYLVHYLALLFAGKVPVILNPNLGAASLFEQVRLANAETILCSRKMLDLLENRGLDTAGLREKLVDIHNLQWQASLLDRFIAFRATHDILGLVALRWADKAPRHAMLVFSHSGTRAIELTHMNVATSIEALRSRLGLAFLDSLLVTVPPHHLCGMCGFYLMPLALGIKTQLYPRPHDGFGIAALCDAFRPTWMVSSVDSMVNILRGMRTAQQLQSVRGFIHGGERCPPFISEVLATTLEGASTIEIYGCPECSGPVACPPPGGLRPNSIGPVLDHLTAVVIDPHSNKEVPEGTPGLLLVRGPAVFQGYTSESLELPFLLHHSCHWYSTNDEVVRDADGYLSVSYSRQRQARIGGNDVSLTVLEDTLEQMFPPEDKAAPEAKAVAEAKPAEEEGGELPEEEKVEEPKKKRFAIIVSESADFPEFVLFTTESIDPDPTHLNKALHELGFSPVHNICFLIHVNALPPSDDGTGVDYDELERVFVLYKTTQNAYRIRPDAKMRMIEMQIHVGAEGLLAGEIEVGAGTVTDVEKLQYSNKSRLISMPRGPDIELGWIDPGEFLMGSSNMEYMRFDNEGPQHPVTLTQGFWMSRFLVTQVQWFSLMGTKPWRGRKEASEALPVEGVSWVDCQEFLYRLNQRFLGKGHCSLPTEAQWEYACRAGTTTEFSGQLDDIAWYYGNSDLSAHPVGQKPPNAWGLYDMHGNLCEWTQDWFENYVDSLAVDPEIIIPPKKNSGKTIRGGSYATGERYCRSAWRNARNPELRSHSIGFRIIFTDVPQESESMRAYKERKAAMMERMMQRQREATMADAAAYPNR